MSTTAKTVQCASCSREYISASGKSTVCPGCRQASNKQLPVPAADVNKAATDTPATAKTLMCATCSREYISASGKSTVCPACRQNAAHGGMQFATQPVPCKLCKKAFITTSGKQVCPSCRGRASAWGISLHPLTPWQILQSGKHRVHQAFIFADPQAILPTDLRDSEAIHLVPSDYGLQVVLIKGVAGMPSCKVLASWPRDDLKAISWEGGKEEEDADMFTVQLSDSSNTDAKIFLECFDGKSLHRAVEQALDGASLMIEGTRLPDLPINLYSAADLQEMWDAVSAQKPCDECICAAEVYTWDDPSNSLPEKLRLLMTSEGMQFAQKSDTASEMEPLIFFFKQDLLNCSGAESEDPTEMDIFQFTVAMTRGGWHRYSAIADQFRGKQKRTLKQFLFECEGTVKADLSAAFKKLVDVSLLQPKFDEPEPESGAQDTKGSGKDTPVKEESESGESQADKNPPKRKISLGLWQQQAVSFSCRDLFNQAKLVDGGAKNSTAIILTLMDTNGDHIVLRNIRTSNTLSDIKSVAVKSWGRHIQARRLFLAKTNAGVDKEDKELKDETKSLADYGISSSTVLYLRRPGSKKEQARSMAKGQSTKSSSSSSSSGSSTSSSKSSKSSKSSSKSKSGKSKSGKSKSKSKRGSKSTSGATSEQGSALPSGQSSVMTTAPHSGAATGTHSAFASTPGSDDEDDKGKIESKSAALKRQQSVMVSKSDLLKRQQSVAPNDMADYYKKKYGR